VLLRMKRRSWPPPQLQQQKRTAAGTAIATITTTTGTIATGTAATGATATGAAAPLTSTPAWRVVRRGAATPLRGIPGHTQRAQRLCCAGEGERGRLSLRLQPGAMEARQGASLPTASCRRHTVRPGISSSCCCSNSSRLSPLPRMLLHSGVPSPYLSLLHPLFPLPPRQCCSTPLSHV
jgi:hypothetical protein